MRDKLINRLTDFIQFEREIRAASSVNALGFTACNYLRKLLTYDVAVLLVEKSGTQRVNTISGVSDFDAGSPLVTACEVLCNQRDISLENTRVQHVAELPPKVAQKLSDIQLSQLVTVGLGNSYCSDQNRKKNTKNHKQATLVLTREQPWQKHELQLLQQAGEAISHAISALQSKSKPSLLRSISPGLKPDWRWAVCGLALISFIPVPQSIIANAEVTARSPVVVSAGLNGVVEKILVRPNERVSEGQLLLRFDSTDLTHRKNTLGQELALAIERLRKARQHSLNATVERSEFAELASQIELKQLELDYVNESITRLVLRADTDGIVIYSRNEDWMGRAVSTGEKIMQIASANDNQFEIWVAANDAIEISQGNAIKFFPDAQPLQSVKGSVDSVGFFASQSDSSQLAYRVVAEPGDNSETLRLGMKGTARLYGEKVSLAYHVFRKPISAIRKTVGV